MLSRRELGGGLAAGAVFRRRGSERPATPPEPAKEPNLARILRTRRLRVGAVSERGALFLQELRHWPMERLFGRDGGRSGGGARGRTRHRRNKLGRDGHRPAHRQDRPRLRAQSDRAARDVRGFLPLRCSTTPMRSSPARALRQRAGPSSTSRNLWSASTPVRHAKRRSDVLPAMPRSPGSRPARRRCSLFNRAASIALSRLFFLLWPR